MANFFAELKRRHIYRVAAAYAVVAWVLLQLIANVAPILELPPWVARAFLLLLVIGFPLAILLAWTREPEGDLTQRAITGRLDWVLMGALVVVIALVSYQQLVPMSGIATAAQKPGVEAAREAATSPVGAISIAVLPFENLSVDPDQEFFSAGMTEEITTALAKIPDLRVVARTSAFQFKSQKRDVQVIGQTLHATHFIEGSVRKAGTRLRIAAQLVNAENGVSLWAENYDREYTDVFAIQEDIATAIAGALRMPLGLKPGELLVNNRTSDLKAYEDYLRIRVIDTLARAVPNARAVLEGAVARDASFAPAWATLAGLYRVGSNGMARQSGPIEDVRRSAQSLLDKAEMAARMAIELDPRHARGHGELGGVLARRGNWIEAEKLFQEALALDPDEPETLAAYGIMLAGVGRLKDAMRVHENLVRVEPLAAAYNYNAAVTMGHNGLYDREIALLEPLLATGSFTRDYALAQAYAAQGRYSEAADTLFLITDQVSPQAAQDASRLLRTAPAKTKSPKSLPVLQADLGFVYAYVGAPERVLDNTERVVKIGVLASQFRSIWDPWNVPLRNTERFKKLLRDAHVLDYWRAKGWPEQCHPTTGDDFVCN